MNEQKLGAQPWLSFNFRLYTPTSKATHELHLQIPWWRVMCLQILVEKSLPGALAVPRAVSYDLASVVVLVKARMKETYRKLAPNQRPCWYQASTSTTRCPQDYFLGSEWFPWFHTFYFVVCSQKESGSGLFLMDSTALFDLLAWSHSMHLSSFQYLRTIYLAYTSGPA